MRHGGVYHYSAQVRAGRRVTKAPGDRARTHDSVSLTEAAAGGLVTWRPVTPRWSDHCTCREQRPGQPGSVGPGPGSDLNWA